MISIFHYRRAKLIVLSAVLFCVAATATQAANSVAPAVIDIKAKARDILSETITVKNGRDRKISLYPTVQNIELVNGRQTFIGPSNADLAASLANWIQVTRGAIDLEPFEEKTIPFEIRVNLTAKPGIYHAIVAFPEGATRDQAERGIATAPATTINLEVLDETKENLELKRFAPTRRFFSQGNAGFSYDIENSGDTIEVPQGDILIYDRSGAEIAALPANPHGVAIEPKATKTISVPWHTARGIGRYKALLTVSYGAKQPGRLQDTAFFWMLPIPLILGILGALFGITVGSAWWFHTRYERAQRHAYRRALLSRQEAAAPMVHAAPRPARREPQVSNIVDLRNMRVRGGKI
jgi:hypothetical protein